MTLFGIWTGALRSKSSRSWRISLSSSDIFVLRAGVLFFLADVLRLEVISFAHEPGGIFIYSPVWYHGFSVPQFIQSDLRDLSVFVMILLAEDYCRLFSAWRSDEEPTAGC